MRNPLKSNQKTKYYRLIFVILVTFLFSHNCYSSNTNSNIDSLLNQAYQLKDKNLEEAINFSEKALALSKRDNLTEKQYLSLVSLTKYNIKAGNYGDAVDLSLKAQKIAESNDYSDYYVESTMLIGSAYLAMGFSKDALVYFLETIGKVTEKTGFKDKLDLNYFIASAYYKINEIEKSRNYLYSCVNISTSNNFLLGAFDSYMFLSNSFQNLDSVNKYLNLANEVIIDYPQSLYKKVLLRNQQAMINKALGNLILSKKQYLEAISISNQNGYKYFLSSLYNNYSYLLMAEDKPDSALIVLEKALEIAKIIRRFNTQASIYDSYSDYFSSISDYKNALIYMDSSINKRKQYRTEQQIQESLFLSAVFETEQKEKEIINQEKEILEKENRLNQYRVFQVLGIASLIFVIGLVLYFRQKFQLSKSRLQTVEKNKELEVSDAMVEGQDIERERLAMDLHDGLGARLSSMRFFADRFFRSNEKYDELTDFIATINKDVRDLSHRMKPTQLESLGLPAIINNIAKTVNKSDKFKVDFKTNIKRRFSDKLELNIYYLINELINNATKHSDGNVISIQLYEEENNIISLAVEDDGSGFNPNKTSDGMGLKNIKSRVEYLGGTLLIESSGTETQFLIEIPI